VLVLNLTLFSVHDKSRLTFVLGTAPAGHHTDFSKEFADFLSLLSFFFVLFVGDFNIHLKKKH